MIKLSIIVPVYNVEDYLRKCIDSILNQKFQDFELILINDGSIDSSGQICDEYANRYGKIKVIHKSNGGLSSARNAGIDIANGEYLGFIDSDDWIDGNMYNDMLSKVRNQNIDIVACNIMLMKSNGEETPYTKINKNLYFTREQALAELYENKILLFSACNKIYHKKLFDGLRYKEGIILEDMDLSYKLFSRAKEVYYIHRAYYHYRYNNDSILRSKFTLKRLDEYIVRNEMYQFYCKKYPSISDLVYYYVADTGSYLFAQIKQDSELCKNEFKYLIKYDNKVLKRILFNKSLKKKERFKILLFILVPKTENKLRKLKYRINYLKYSKRQNSN